MEKTVVVCKEKCYCCGKESSFLIEQGATLLREAACEHCGASLRNSDVMKTLKKTTFNGQLFEKCKNKLYIVNTSSYGGVHCALKHLPNYIYSEYYPNIPSGQRAENGVLCVNLLNMPFDDESLDVIISEDVLEHIEDYMVAFREIKRVLKPGGVHVFTVPIREDGHSMFRKEMPPIYHDAPEGTGGALLYNDFSFDLCQIYTDNEVETACEEMHTFYPSNQVNHLENEYEEYLQKKDVPLFFYRLNSWVFTSRKREKNSARQRSSDMEFTGERFIPGQTDIELEIEHLNRYQFARQFVLNKIVLDAACGEGYGSNLLARDAAEVYGIDISEESIIHARNKYENKRITFQVASVCELPFATDTFDVIVSFETLEHIDEVSQLKFIQEICRVLKKDGILVISTPNHRIYKRRGENHFHVRELEYREFKTLLEEKFPCVTFFSQQFEIANAISAPDNMNGVIQSQLSPENAEYLIAVCAQHPIANIVSRSIIRDDGKLQQLMDWAVYNHELNEKNNIWIANANTELEELRREIEDNKAIYAKELKDQDAAYAQIVEENEKQYQSEKNALLQQIDNKEGHIALLLESERELDRIKASRSWRFMGYFWKFRDALIPKGSKRRLLGKMLVKLIKHPVRFLKKCTPTRIGKFFTNLRREGVEGTSRRLDDCLIGNEIHKTELEIAEVTGGRVAPKTIVDYAPLKIPQWDNPQVSIVIPVYNQFEYTYLCIQSIIKNSGEIHYEILIADDCSNDLTVDIEQVISGLCVIRNAENLRFLKNCNNAAKYAKGKYILFLNNDTQVQENWLAPLIELIERDRTIGMVGSKLVYPDGRLQEAGGILWRDGSAWNYGNRSDPDLPEYNYVKEVDYISGAAIMIRHELWKEIGGFDERFAPAYCEDSDLAFEVRKHGYKVMYQPKSVVIHFEGISNGTDTSSGQKAYQVTNQKKFYEKWKDVLQTNHLPNGVKPFLARDRAVDRKVLLMIDHYVPQFDRDAGSKTVFQYLQMFVMEGFSVKFIGDNFYPHQPYTDTLQQIGVEVLYGPYYAKHWKTWLTENGEDIGYVFLNRPHISIKYIDELRKYTKAKIVYYGHDLHFLREKREYDLCGDVALLKSSQQWEEKELQLMRAADMSYYPSCVEVEEIHKIAPDVKVKAIPAYLFADVQPTDYDYAARQNLMFIGGFRHRPNVDAVIWLANEIMPRLLELLPDVCIYILGSNPPEEVVKLNNSHLQVKGFVTDQELEEYYQNCRLSIVPLRYGAGIKGKVIEAMRYGMPVMTTSIGAEGIQNADSILEIADDAKAFAEKLAALYQNADELCARSEASYRYVRENFSFENAKQVIAPEFDLELSK